jgi:hypothetical protein
MRVTVRPSLPFAQALLLIAGFTASACTAILVPDKDGKDDGVLRCNNVDDCPDDLGDNRFRYQCEYGEGQDPMSSKVCVADFEEVECDPTMAPYAGDHPFAEAYADATDNASKSQYVGCTPENIGKQGCGFSMDVACADGLAPNEDGICDDSDPNTPPAISPTKIPESIEAAGQDVRDQFCRWRFGDENWVCDTTENLCRECDSDKEFGEGGCGLLYLQGAPSTVYTDLSDANVDGDLEDDLVTFGAIPEPA